MQILLLSTQEWEFWPRPSWWWLLVLVILTFANTEDVLLLSEQQRQALHQQQSFVVAQDWCLPLVEHLIQRSSLNLKSKTGKSQASLLFTILIGLYNMHAIRPLYFTICTVWLKSSRSAVMEVIWSIRRCFLLKKCSRRVLSERQDATLDLYNSFSLLTTGRWKQMFLLRVMFYLYIFKRWSCLVNEKQLHTLFHSSRGVEFALFNSLHGGV